jgi:hypothetical protein
MIGRAEMVNCSQNLDALGFSRPSDTVGMVLIQELSGLVCKVNSNLPTEIHEFEDDLAQFVASIFCDASYRLQNDQKTHSSHKMRLMRSVVQMMRKLCLVIC